MEKLGSQGASEEEHFARLVGPSALVGDIANPFVVVRIGVEKEKPEPDAED